MIIEYQEAIASDLLLCRPDVSVYPLVCVIGIDVDEIKIPVGKVLENIVGASLMEDHLTSLYLLREPLANSVRLEIQIHQMQFCRGRLI